MAHFDAADRAFIDKLSSKKEKDEGTSAATVATIALRTARKALQGGPPERALARAATKILAEEVFQKQAGLPPLKIYLMLNDHYGREWWDWEPETLWHHLQEDHATEATPEIKNIVMALQTVLKTNYPFEMWHVFEKVNHAFNLNMVDFATLQPAELDEAAWTISLLQRIRPKTEFEDDIWGYIAAVAKESGVVYLPPQLYGGSKRPQELLDGLNNDLELAALVRQAGLRDPQTGDSTALKVQLLRLKEIQSYLEDNKSRDFQ
jgi:hypothetical protein